MRIAVTGSSGLIGGALVPALRTDGHEVLRLVRRTPRTADEHRWDPQHRRIDGNLLTDVDAVVNLAGESIRPRPWTRSYEMRLLQSRLDSTATVSEAFAAAALMDPTRPRVLVSGSGVSIYGDTGDRLVDESAPVGSGFMAEMPDRWESATAPAEAAGIRVAHARTGLVIARGAPLMQVLGLAFRLGLGGRVASGAQYWPWIGLVDEVGALRHLLTAEVSGPVNLTAPAPVTNAEFTRTLSAVVHRPAVLPIPGWPLTFALRDFGRSTVLGGQRAVPQRLLESGYEFQQTDLAASLQEALARP